MMVRLSSDAIVRWDYRWWRLITMRPVCHLAYYHLWQMRPIIQSLSRMLQRHWSSVHVKSPRLLQLCGVLHHQPSFSSASAVNTECGAASLITPAGRRDHISPVLRELQWLPVRRRVDFKMAILMFKSLYGQAPQYLSEECQLLPDVIRQLRSSNMLTCHWPELSWVVGELLWLVQVFKTWCQHRRVWWMIVCALCICWKHTCLIWGCGANWLLFVFMCHRAISNTFIVHILTDHEAACLRSKPSPRLMSKCLLQFHHVNPAGTIGVHSNEPLLNHRINSWHSSYSHTSSSSSS